MAVKKNLVAIDTYINSERPDTNYGKTKRLGVSYPTQFAYVSFAKPFPVGARITRATLSWVTWGDMPEAGAHVFNVTPVTSPIAYTRVTHNTRPDRDLSKQVEVSKAGPVAHATTWEVDVSDWMQDVSNGEPWYGFRIGTSDTAQRWIYSRNSTNPAIPGPSLHIEYADEPDAPDSLAPNEGVVGTAKPDLTFDYVDYGGSTVLGGLHVQTSTTPSFAVPAWDSGEQDAHDPVAHLDEMGYPGAAQGERVYWRVRARDQDNLWSDWSPAAWFTYEPIADLTLLTPNEGTPLFGDSTPDITWNFAGTQTAYLLRIFPEGDYTRPLYDSGWRESTSQIQQVSAGTLPWDDASYDVVLRVRDEHDRVRAPNSLPYAYVKVTAFFDEDLAMTPASNIQARQVGVTPDVEVTWERSVSADSYEISRLNKAGRRIILDQPTHAEVVQPDGTYRFVDRTCPPQTELRYYIRPSTNGKRGARAASALFESYVEAIWLTTSDGVALAIDGSDQGSWALPENATSHRVIGSRAPVVVRELYSGYEIGMNGILVEEEKRQPDLSAQDKYRIFLDLKVAADEPRLIVADQNLPVRLAEMDAYPTPHVNLRYECSFKAYQHDEIWWEK